MARGFIGGILLGGVFSVAVAGFISFLVPIGPVSQELVAVPKQPEEPVTAQAPSQLETLPVTPAETLAPAQEIEPETAVDTADMTEPAKGELLDTSDAVDAREPDVAVAETIEPVETQAGEIAATEAEVIAEIAADIAADIAPENLGENAAENAGEADADLMPSDGVVDTPAIVALQEPEAPEPSVPALPEVTEDRMADTIPEAEPGPTMAPNLTADATQNIVISAPSDAPEAEVPDISPDAPVFPNPLALAPMEPAEPDVVRIETEPAQPTTETPAPEIALVPEAEDSAQLPTTVGPAFGTTEGRPTIGAPASITSERDTGVTINRLPTSQSPERVADSKDPADARAITRYKNRFTNVDDKPLMGILLIDTGVELNGGEVGIAALRSFPYPISFAVDASLPDAADRMRTYRAEGFEVLAMVDLPQGAQATDAETTLNVAFSRLPEVIGVLEGQGEGLQPNRAVSDQVSAILRQGGYGLVSQDKGLNTMPKLAVKDGVPAAAVFRDFDSKDQTATVIRRFLDQAAFKAGIEGSVIMLGRMRPETISALLVWGLQDRASQVALAPISAVLLDQLGE